MPHKHRRTGRSKNSPSFDLPPSTRHARPLPARTTQPTDSKPSQKQKLSNKAPDLGYDADDTPRAFTRLMRLMQPDQKPRSGLDGPRDGTKRGKKRKRQAEEDNVNGSTRSVAPKVDAAKTISVPKIQPGERLSSFSARVDAALPIGGLKTKGNKAIDRSIGVQGDKLTKLERKMRRMRRQWREEDGRRKAKQEDLAAEMEDDDEWTERVEMARSLQGSSAQKKRKRKDGAEADEDPWAAIKKARGDEGKQKSLTDVVQAPPKLGIVREKFKVKVKGDDRLGVEVANVPVKAGSLRRREELGQTRQSVVEQYRKLKREE